MAAAVPGPNDQTSLQLQRAAAGDAAAVGFLVERFTPPLLAQARFRMGPALQGHEPEDLVQDVWAIALPRLPDLRPRDGKWTPVLLKFLATTLLRRVNELLRRTLRRQALLGRPLVAGAGDGDGIDPLQQLPAEVSGVVTRLCRAQRQDALQQALHGLPEEQRQVVLLRGIEQLGNREVARLLGVADSVVTRRFQAALRRLQELLPGSVFADLEAE